jgi:hypothetical protein
MRFFCNAPRGRTWFALETQVEADAESALMTHAVARHFERAHAAAVMTYAPANPNAIERDIGLKAHVRRTMPTFLTLRADDGTALATAMLAPEVAADTPARLIIVGPNNADPYPAHSDAIAALAAHVGYDLPRSVCFPYR